MSIDRIYMDSCCFIESVKHEVGKVQGDRDNALWYIQQLLLAARKSEIEVLTSYLTIAESRHTKTPESKKPSEEVKRLFRSVLSSGKVVKLAELTQSIAEKARDLHWEYDINLSGADSIHVATALVTGCKEFLTFDFNKSKSPLKFATELKKLGLIVIEPSKTTLLPASYKQMKLPTEEK